jgi:hypothetical protein
VRSFAAMMVIRGTFFGERDSLLSKGSFRVCTDMALRIGVVDVVWCAICHLHVGIPSRSRTKRYPLVRIHEPVVSVVEEV